MSGWWLLAAVPLLPLLLTWLNVATWRRGRAGSRWAGRLSVLVPARNEAANIEACLRAVLASRHPIAEVIVCDDHSDDDTRAIVERLGGAHPEVRVIAGAPLPPGWVGQPPARHQLALAARGDVLLFVDADTRLEPEGIERLLSLFEAGVDVVTAVPRQVMASFAERLVMPLLVLTYTSWFPLRLVAASRDPRFLAANGQLLAVRREAYDRLGGFAAVKHEIVDDVAFCRRAKEQGSRVVFADGSAMASCRMYDSAGAIWRGFSKNLYEGIGGTAAALVVVLALHLLVFVAPYVALALGALLDLPALLLPGLVGVGLNVALRATLCLRYGHPWSGILLHPLSILVLCAIAVSSYRWTRRGALAWAGRVYPERERRLALTGGEA